jgi:hypothetical protein
MSRSGLTPALAASSLLVLALAASASSAPKPHRAGCGAAQRARASAVPGPSKVVSAGVSAPKTVDMRTVPKVPEAPSSTGAPPELPSPGITHAKKLKAAASGCVPQSAPTVPGTPTIR